MPTYSGDRRDVAGRGPEPDGRAFMIMPDGALLRVLDDGAALVPWYPPAKPPPRPRFAWQPPLPPPARYCACGRVCGAASARTCGDRACIDALAA